MRALFLVVALSGCRAVVESGVTYRECDASQLFEGFDGDTSMEALAERCWQVDNVENDPDKVGVHDGDLVIKVSEPIHGRLEQWVGSDQGPMVFQNIEGDFLMAARIETLDQGTGDHCLISPGEELNMAGLVVRRDAEWSTFFLAPFFPEPGMACDDMADPPPPTKAVITSESWDGDAELRNFMGAPLDSGIGNDGEADILICRYADELSYYVRLQSSPPEMPVWEELPVKHIVGEGPLDFGMTASGHDPVYTVEGHFDWVLFDRIEIDGCGSRFALVLPPVD